LPLRICCFGTSGMVLQQHKLILLEILAECGKNFIQYSMSGSRRATYAGNGMNRYLTRYRLAFQVWGRRTWHMRIFGPTICGTQTHGEHSPQPNCPKQTDYRSLFEGRSYSIADKDPA
jgi:hypothetical protein